MPSLLSVEDKKCAGGDQHEAKGLAPCQRTLQVESREDREYQERDDFLDRLQLCGRKDRAANSIGGHREAILDEGQSQLIRMTEKSGTSL
jgi:hypothetical protein